MKKVLLVMVTIATLIFGSAAFAQELGLGQSLNDTRARYEQFVNTRKDQLRDLQAKVRENKATIERNRLEIKNLQLQLNENVKQVKSRVKELKKDRNLDAGKITMIRQTLASIDQAHRVLGASQGELQRKNLQLRDARQSQRPGEFLQTMDGIIEIQKKRIDKLNSLIADLEKLNGYLQ